MEAYAYAFIVLLPVLLWLIVLLAEARIKVQTGSRRRAFRDWFRFKVLSLELLSVFSILMAFGAIWIGARNLAKWKDWVTNCLSEAAINPARLGLPEISVPDNIWKLFMLLFLVSAWALHVLYNRRYAHDKSVGVADVVLVWGIFAFVYTVYSTTLLHDTLSQLHRWYESCSRFQ